MLIKLALLSPQDFPGNIHCSKFPANIQKFHHCPRQLHKAKKETVFALKALTVSEVGTGKISIVYSRKCISCTSCTRGEASFQMGHVVGGPSDR